MLLRDFVNFLYSDEPFFGLNPNPLVPFLIKKFPKFLLGFSDNLNYFSFFKQQLIYNITNTTNTISDFHLFPIF